MFVKDKEIPILIVVSNTIIVLHIMFVTQWTQCDESTTRWRLLKEPNTLKRTCSLRFKRHSSISFWILWVFFLKYFYIRVGKYQGNLQIIDANWMWKHLFCKWFLAFCSIALSEYVEAYHGTFTAMYFQKLNNIAQTLHSLKHDKFISQWIYCWKFKAFKTNFLYWS